MQSIDIDNMAQTSVLHTTRLTIGYKRPARAIARDLALTLAAGELVCLLGPNGAGKSTLMRTLAGMQPPLAGQVWLDGADLHTLAPKERATRLSLVLTDQVEVGNLPAYDLVALGRYPYTDWTGHLQAADHAAVEAALTATRADGLALRAMNELSDGERQKVMIARALAQAPAVMLLDEPTAFLDLPHRVEIIDMLRNLARRTRCAILLSTHDLDLALRYADRIWLLAAGGTLQSGAPEDLVLNGAFGSVFGRDGLVFDAQAGAFRSQRREQRGVALSGSGLAALWTARALERGGFRVVSDVASDDVAPVADLPWRVAVQTVDDRTVWHSVVAGERRAHPSIQDLLHHLAAHHAASIKPGEKSVS